MGVLLDIDGTVLDAGRAIDGAAAAIDAVRSAGRRILFATNTSRKSRASVAASLRAGGIAAQDDEILSANYAAATLLRSRGVRSVHLLLTPDAAEDWVDFETTSDAPEAVVVGDLGSRFDFERLNTAFRHLHAGARLVATQKNRYWKSESGWTLDAGAFVAALEYSARTEAEIVGKPAPGFFRMAAELLGESVDRITIVGDDLETDVVGGLAAGMNTVLVRTGKFDADRLREAPDDATPNHVIDSIRDLPAILPARGPET